MQYYDPNDKRPFIGAAVAAALYAVCVAIVFVFVEFRSVVERRISNAVELDFIEQELPEQDVKPEEQTTEESHAPLPKEDVVEPVKHENYALENNDRQVTGKDEITQTINPKAIFHADNRGADEPEDEGNPYAPEGDDNSAQGDGDGLKSVGTGKPDEGLEGRGIEGALPRPVAPGNKEGRVCIHVTINAEGKVINAVFVGKGSTLQDSEYIKSSTDAAKKTVFKKKEDLEQEGIITYIYKLK